MKFRFRKSKKILPGVKINVTNKGISANVGPKGANLGVGKRGVRANVSAPGTGISGSQKVANGCGSLVALGMLIAVVLTTLFILR